MHTAVWILLALAVAAAAAGMAWVGVRRRGDLAVRRDSTARMLSGVLAAGAIMSVMIVAEIGRTILELGRPATIIDGLALCLAAMVAGGMAVGWIWSLGRVSS